MKTPLLRGTPQVEISDRSPVIVLQLRDCDLQLSRATSYTVRIVCIYEYFSLSFFSLSTRCYAADEISNLDFSGGVQTVARAREIAVARLE